MCGPAPVNKSEPAGDNACLGLGPGQWQSVFKQSRIGHAVGIHESDILSTRSAYSQISSRVRAGAFLDKQSYALTALRDGEAFIQGAIIHQDYLIFVPR